METEPEPEEVNDSQVESKVDNTRNITVYGNYNESIQGNYNQNSSSSEHTKGNQYDQRGSLGIGHMSGGKIEKGAKVAGVIIDAKTVNVIPQPINNQNTPCNIKRTGSANFVGRTEKLEELHQLLQQNEKVTISAIAGMGGIGKTELALQYAIKYQDNYPGSLCWFSVRGQNLVTQIIEFASSYLNLFVPDEYKSDLSKVEYCWGNWRNEKSLIVLDDVPDYEEFYQKNIKPYLPTATNNIKVLMTSRERPGANISQIDLDVLTEAVALELLEKLIGKSRIEAEPNLAKELCKWLGYLPLGLELVGRYIALDQTLTIEKTLTCLEKRKLKARALLDPQQADMTAQLGVATAFDLSWDALSPEAQDLGCYLSLFTSEPFKWSWVETACIESDDEDDRELQIENLEELRNWQLIKRNLLKVVTDSQSSTRYNYQLHSLIAQYFRAKLEERENAAVLKQKFCEVMVEIAQSIPQTPTQKEIQEFAITVPHISIVVTKLTQYIDDEDLIWPYASLDNFYSGQGIYNQAEKWLEYSLRICRKRLGEQHQDVANIINNLALLYCAQGKYEESENFNLQALESYKQTLGEQHPNVAMSFNNLAALYHSQGRYEEAESFNLRALELYKQLLGEQHPDIAKVLNNLAQLYYSQGRYEEAEPLYQEALELYKQVLGEQHSNIAKVLNNLSQLYYSQGKYEEAENSNLKAIKLYKQTLGEQHPDVAKSLSNLAVVYHSQGRYEEAESFNLRALELYKQLLGEQHPDIAKVLNNLAQLYYSQGKYEEAENFNLKAIKLYKQTLGEQHPDVAKSLNNLALIYYSQGRYEEAEPLYQQALELYKQVLGEQHPDIAKVLNNLALIYYYQEKYEEAESITLQALKLYEQLFEGQHPDVMPCLNSLALLYDAQGKYDEAELLFLQTIELNKQLLGEKHPNVAMIFNNLAVSYDNQGKYDKSAPLYLQALEIAKEVLGEDHPHTNMFRDNLNYAIKMQQNNQLWLLAMYLIVISIIVFFLTWSFF